MAAAWYTQLAGERRGLTFDFSALLGAGETVLSVAITAATLRGAGAARVSAQALSDDGAAASCMVSASAAGVYLITASAACTAQTLVLQATIEAVPAGAAGAAAGAYAGVHDLQARYGSGELAALGDDAGARAGAALRDASAEIDAALARRYALPLHSGSTWPQLADIACALARIRLYDDEAPAPAARAAEHARRRLEGLGAGTVLLIDSAGRSPAAGAATARRTAGGGPAFTRETLEAL